MLISNRNIQYLASFVLSVSFSSIAWADCEIVDTDGKASAFDGKSLAGLQVEKKSLLTLSKAYPELNVLEKTFKGEVQTCASCSDKFVRCTND